LADVLVIGCKGQLGTDCLSVMGAQAVGVDLPELDISDCFQCLEKLNSIAPKVIVNCAAYTAVDACETDPACWKVNADGPKHLAGWAAANDAFLVHVSTDYVFDGEKSPNESYLEDDETNPVSEYGKSKLAGEQAVLDSGANAAVIRTAWLYGATGKNFLKTMLRLAVQNPEKEIRVVNDQFGSPTRSHTLARQIAAVVEARVTGLFHATSEGSCSWFELAESFLSLMGVSHRVVPCTTDEYPAPAKRPVNSILENAALKKNNLNISKHWKTELEEFVLARREELLR